MRKINVLFMRRMSNPSHITTVKYALKNKAAPEEPDLLDYYIRNKETQHKHSMQQQVIFYQSFHNSAADCFLVPFICVSLLFAFILPGDLSLHIYFGKHFILFIVLYFYSVF